jgi:hypothetical protein
MPTVAEVNAAEDKFCGFLSDLEDFAVMLEAMAKDVARMQRLDADLKSTLLALYRESATDLQGDRVA